MASGDTLLEFFPQENNPSATPATQDTRNRHPVLDFDAATDESAIFGGIMPQNYEGTTGVTVLIHFSMSTATSGDVVWNAAVERVTGQDIDSDGFAADNTVTDTVNASSGIQEVASITFTDGADMDSVTAGETFRLRITRDADNASDTAVGDAEVYAVEIRET